MIPETDPYNNWSGNGLSTTFDFDFYIEDESQLAVYLTGTNGVQTQLTYGTDYSIHEFKNENGSYITYPISGSTHDKLAIGETISLCLTLPISQEEEYAKSGYLNPETIEYSLDYLTRLIQIYARVLQRAVKVKEGSDIDTDTLAINLNKVADISADVSTVAGNTTNVNTVADDLTNINTVAGSIANVNAVANDLTNINAVKNNATNINTVAGSISNVNSVASDLANINAVKNKLSKIDTVANDLTNIDNVAGDLTNIDAVAGKLSNIDAVKTDLTNIDTVAESISSVNSVANDLTNINAVKNNATNINTVAGSISNVNNVGSNIAKINDVADDLTNIDAVAADLDNIDAASANAALAKDWANKMNGSVDGVEYSAKYYAQQASQGQIQANWNEVDTTSKSYIQNKPTLATVATSGAYSDLTGTPTIPTVNNATLTIQKNSVDVQTFTANASSNVTCNITVPTNTNELTNGAGFITGINSTDVTTALSYTPADTSLSNLATAGENKLEGSYVDSLVYWGQDVAVDNNTGYSYSLANYLPNDGKPYMVLVYATTAITSSSAEAEIMVGSDLMTASHRLAACYHTARCSGSCWIPVGSGRSITFYNARTGSIDMTGRIIGYRRMGD